MAAVPGERHECPEITSIEVGQAVLSLIAVHINRNDAGRKSGGNADVRLRPLSPPRPDGDFIGRSILAAVLGARMFASVSAAVGVAATAPTAIFRPVQGKHRP